MSDDIDISRVPAPAPEGAAGPADAIGGVPAAAAAPQGASSAAFGQLTPTDLARVAELKKAVDVTDSQLVLSYGLPAQSKLAGFADSLLADVRTKNAGEAGAAVQDLLKKVRGLDIDELATGKKGKFSLFKDTFDKFAQRYQKVATSLEHVVDNLEKARMGLLKDVTVLDKMYELNLEYLKQLDVYIAAGDEALVEMQTVHLPQLEAEARASGDPMAAQRMADYGQSVTRFERRLHDLKLTRTIAIQTAPQIRLIQSNDQNLVEKIQSSILTTVPLWKNQIVIAISLYRQQKAVELQKNVTDTTNELLAKNAELLRTGSAKVGKEVERGVVDIETLQKVNTELIATLEETIQIQEQGRQRRIAAEGEIARMQGDLKTKLLELRSQAPQVTGPDVPPMLPPQG